MLTSMAAEPTRFRREPGHIVQLIDEASLVRPSAMVPHSPNPRRLRLASLSVLPTTKPSLLLLISMPGPRTQPPLPRRVRQLEPVCKRFEAIALVREEGPQAYQSGHHARGTSMSMRPREQRKLERAPPDVSQLHAFARGDVGSLQELIKPPVEWKPSVASSIIVPDLNE
ncbi:hypothetical protein CKAH01_17135 [Colletotrichum kahawae]|uniref:Uncharacterized protein n=1 Tax=Colletotrichum kahawae TaxID=34407 RepID=A0AAE0D5N9_COLKA|nr:hypothetical protein CKAH01_17135 [Colletotrichum kahawae]